MAIMVTSTDVSRSLGSVQVVPEVRRTVLVAISHHYRRRNELRARPIPADVTWLVVHNLNKLATFLRGVGRDRHNDIDDEAVS
jgi:hypothetical protein